MNPSPLLIRPRVLCFVDYYLPGYKAGGPLRTINNMVSQLGLEFEFLIVTRDRDFLDTVPYANVLIDQWNVVDQVKVFYASPLTFSLRGVLRLLRETPHDILYLNSFFSPVTTIMPLIIRRLGFYGGKPVILAPRGEFSVGALVLKSTRKNIYIALAKVTGVCRQLIWQVSSVFELEDVHRVFNNIEAPNIIVAPDLVPLPKQVVEEVTSSSIVPRLAGPLRVVFLSRISPKKNLDYLLRVCNDVNVPVQLSIYGPTEDSDYWAHCQSLIEALPAHIIVKYKGEVTHEKVAQIFSTHDLFVFPTRGENFGHVIYEALAVGTAVIVSDQTPWQSDPHGAVTVLALEQPDVWAKMIGLRAVFDDQAYAAQRDAAVTYATTYQETNQALQQNRGLFLSALDRNPLWADISHQGLK
jgi:glycosyltransferase involved in cell wall biosynthesis